MAENPRGQNFDDNRNLLSLRSFATSLKNLFDFIQFFQDFIHVLSLRVGADNPLGTKFDVNRNILSLGPFVASLKKNLFEVWFYTIFFIILYMYIAMGQGRQPPRDKVLMSTEMSCHFIHLMQVSIKKISLKCDFTQFYSWFNTCL